MEKSCLLFIILGIFWPCLIFSKGIQGLRYLRRMECWPHKFKSYSNIKSTFLNYTSVAENLTVDDHQTWDGNWTYVNFVNNDEFMRSYKYKAFQIDDTDQVGGNQLIGLAWLPDSFGYTKEQGQQVFPDYTYPKWDEIMTERQPNITIDYKSNTFSMDWDGEVILEPLLVKNRQYTKTEMEEYWQIKSYDQQKPLYMKGKEEYVFAHWDGSSIFNSAILEPRRNNTAYIEALKTSSAMDKDEKTRPLHMILLTVDSYSRRHFYRKLPNTIQYLNSLNKGREYRAFDFKLHNVKGSDSVENMLPIFNQTAPQNQNEGESDQLGDTALWNMLRKLGFVTVMGFENCDYNFPSALGRRPQVDHLVRGFYWAAFKFAGYNTAKGSGGLQRWIGNKMSHKYMLDYTYAISNLYPGANLWIYNHINTAHEETGQHAATLDDDLVDFLQQYFTRYSRSNDVVILLHADHGMRYGNWFKDVEAFQENKLPAFFFISSIKYLKTIEYSFDVLKHNSVHLTSKQDLRLTMLDLAYRRYGQLYKKPDEISHAISLISEKAPSERTCNSIGIPVSFCSCLVLKTIDQFYYNDSTTNLGTTINYLAHQAVEELNRQTFQPVSQPLGLTWQHLTLDKVILVLGMAISPKLEEYKIQFSVKESSKALFEVTVVHGTQISGDLMKKYDKGPEIPYPVAEYKNHARMFGIIRKDSYGGPCELMSRALGFRAEF